MHGAAERDTERLLTVPEVMERLAISRASLYRLFATGELPSLHIGASRRVREADVDDFIRNGGQEAS